MPAGLTVVGVGPGDPDLLTLAAVRAIERAQVVAMPVAGEGIESMAAAIASAWIRPDQRRLPLVFPMVEAADPRRDAWHRAAAAIAAEVEQGHAVVLLCEGDASLFATASYVLLALQQRHPGCPVAVVPGITAISAAAAAAAWPLALQQDQLLVMPCPDQPEDLASALEQAAVQSRVLALLKLGRRWRWVQHHVVVDSARHQSTSTMTSTTARGGNRMQSTVNLAIHNLTVKSDWRSVSSIARAVIFAAWHAGRHYGQQKGGHAQRHACC